MHPFGGSPICPRCSKAVYAAEQVLGPGRMLYHKPCLACTLCSKRLDSYTLLEHDQQPYCKSCHTKSFGTRDLRRANLPHREQATPSPTSSPTRSFSPVRQVSPVRANATGTNAASGSPVRAATNGVPWMKPTRALSSPTRNGFPQKSSESPSMEADEEKDTLEIDRYLVPSEESLPVNNTAFNQLHNSSPGVSSQSNSAAAAASLLEKEGMTPLLQTVTNRPFGSPVHSTPTGSRYGAALGGSVTVNLTGAGSPSRKWGGGTPTCPRCLKSVYFAEQVKAVGKTFHKNCLRCVECSTALDSSRLRDHDGEPYCVRCYSKLHGPQGSGYALLGKAGG